MNPALVETICHLIRQELALYPAGLSEYALIKALRKHHLDLPLSPELSLFRSHFLLFHCLYHLREQLLSEQSGLLEIHTLCICLAPWQPGHEGLTKSDPLQAYYMDWQQFASTDQQEVHALLDSFWKRYHLTDSGHLQAALCALELPPEATVDVSSHQLIRRQYQRLAMQHHPDRGGDECRFKEIQSAWDYLRPFLGTQRG
ncbi:DNA-J related domain-containing protein [Pokkaliibacter sp. MBI-7]|uniref:DNA-J related domain-containing protein n=1 Tax=Pokkaliibacter sp. MBI-7 TaxID=3040600 RepID=UPI002447CEC0|nr:DNA-J related domain-containing protein [Pokkaliibacter sp. MBI-7]MDH2434961.1 DNA-J related domain-containing protein [Pokkaliibacter sp. MBI-7]